MVKSDTTMYNFILLFLLGGNNIEGFIRYSLMLSIDACWSLPQTNSLSLLSQRKGENDWVFPLKLEMNLLRKFIFPSKDWSCFFIEWGLRLTISFVLFWLISMPFLCTTNPKKSCACTQKTHFNGFIFNPFFLILWKDCWRWLGWPFSDEDFITISSI